MFRSLLAVCLLAATPLYAGGYSQIPNDLDDPVAFWMERIDTVCEEGWKLDLETPNAPKVSMGKGVFRPTFAEKRDLNRDGRMDVVLNINEHTCDRGYPGAWCGTAGCLTEIWYARPEGGYRRALSTNIWGFDVVEHAGAPALKFKLHGVFCSRVGAVGCVDIRVWDGTKLRKVWKDYE